MKSTVFFIHAAEAEGRPAVARKFKRLLEESRACEALRPRMQAVIKLHFGEQGNAGFVRPEYVRVVCEAVAARGAVPVLADTNTLYKGKRTHSAEHRALAYEHGFVPERVKAEVVIPDDSREEEVRDVPAHGRYVRTAHVVRLFADADWLIDLAHFKGHLMTGFGGVLKNAGMGCASRKGKLFQHGGVAPLVSLRRCTGCGSCLDVCPAAAISLKGKKAAIDPQACIGCASCIAACPVAAIDVKWEAGGGDIQEKMVEYACALLQPRKGRSLFIDVATKITRECDCLAKDDPRIVPDIGIFLSADPVACDKACLDAVTERAGADIFRQLHPKRNGIRQLEYARELGLGSMDYRLLEIKEEE